jgi:hypothetical protein
LPAAIVETERVIEAQASSMDPTVLRAARRFVRNAKRWWTRSNVLYINVVVKVLDAKSQKRYSLGSGYTWTYPGQGAGRAGRALRTAFGNLGDAPVSESTRAFLQPTKKRSTKRGTPGQLVQTGNIFFADEISPTQRARMMELETLHDEAARSQLCKSREIGLDNPGWCPGERPAPEVLEEYVQKTIDGVLNLGLPHIAPFARGTSPALTFEELCPIVQRKVHAHRLWTEGVLRGHTPRGFRDAWVAGFAHAMVHVYGFLEVPGSVRLRPAVRKIMNFGVPGVVNGECRIDGIDPVL